ncbi:MAG: tail fiber domain-containing protein, partial [Patescibacteria group bacterium]
KSDGDVSAFSDLQFIQKTAPATGNVYGWQISHRKDGYFSGSTSGSLEFYGVIQGGGYYAPLSFKNNGDVILVSPRGATTANVGIGTTAPNSKLQFSSNNFASDAGAKTFTGAAINADGGDIATGRILFQGYSNSATDIVGVNNEANRLVLYNYTDNRYLQIWNHSGDTYLVPAAGNVGIGTTNPQTHVEIYSASGANLDGTVTFGTNTDGLSLHHDSATNGNGAGLWFYNSGLPAGIASTRVNGGNWATDLRFYTHPAATSNQNVLSERMRINSEGNVGVGVTNPLYKLDVNGNTRAMDSIVLQGSAGINPVFIIKDSDDTDGQRYDIGEYQDKLLIGYGTNWATVGGGLIAVFDRSTGNVGIGTTAPDYPLDVQSATGDRVRFKTSLGEIHLSSYAAGSEVYAGADSFYVPSRNINIMTGLNNGEIRFNAVNSGVWTRLLTIASNGNAVFLGSVTATAFIYSSDRNLKQNIATIQSPLEKITQLRGVTFNWKKDNKPSMGLIAQEVEQVFPELVTGQEGSKAVQYGNLVAPLIEAVKAQQTEIKNNNEEIMKLKAQQVETIKRLKSLENKNKKK